MLFFLIRVLIGGAASVFSVFKVNHSKIVKKRFYSVLIVVALIVAITAMTMFPLENCFISFRTPETVCKYSVIGEVSAILEGCSSAFAVYQTGASTYSTCVIPKTLSSYKIPTYFSAEKVSQKIDDCGIITTFCAKRTNDYYIVAMIPNDNGKYLQVFNLNGKIIETQSITLENTDITCIYLQSFSKDYFVLVDGERVYLG